MNVKGVTESQIFTAAYQVGVHPYNVHLTRNGFTFTLKTGDKTERRNDWKGKSKLMPKYQRTSQRERRSTAKGYEGVMFNPIIPGAVCWHGHRAFFRALYALAPQAKIRTAVATYTCREHFEATHEQTLIAGGNRMGYPITPYAQACTCD